ncbi:MAG: hypothetical protein SAK29_22390 [Scytonema sp. PMC 1069.18]|nr:hypothetical protein [Scytonema sp. PMC 1069.18]MEC4885023.1 hypothetical protein [Scytonema sp. PMC 1070.18]
MARCNPASATALTAAPTMIILRKNSPTGTVTSINFSPDGNTIVSGGVDSTIKLWSKDGTELRTLKNHYYEVTNVCFSSDSSTIASADISGIIKLWSKNGTELQTLKIKSRGYITSMKFSPNGKTLACTSDTGEIILWNFDLDDLLKKGCNWLCDYLQNNPNVSPEDKHLCEYILMK